MAGAGGVGTALLQLASSSRGLEMYGTAFHYKAPAPFDLGGIQN